MPKKRVRIKDIAAAAGVSTGTVDRVIHNRGNVMPVVKKRVEEVMKNLNYRPNIMARTLANNKVLKIGVLLPNFEQDVFWKAPIQGIEKAIAANQHFLIDLQYYFFEETNAQSYVKQTNQVLKDELDALIIAPIFKQESQQFLQALGQKNIPFVLINTHLPEVASTCYIGQDSFQSGVLAARLISDRQPIDAGYLILHLEEAEEIANAAHIYQKEAGFYAYFEHLPYQPEIVKRAFSDKDSTITLDQFIQNVLKEFPIPAGIFISTSKTYQFIEYANNLSPHTIIIGFDLLPQNVAYLKAGKIDYLINQHPEKQGFLAITNLIDALLLKKSVNPIQYLPLDIVVKENVDYYL